MKNKHLKRLLFPIMVSSIILIGCVETMKLDDLNSEISLNPALALPIGSVHAYMTDLLSFTDSTYIGTDTCNGVYVYYKEDNQNMHFQVDDFSEGETLDETLTLRTVKEFEDIFKLLDDFGIKETYLPAGSYPFTRETMYHFGFNEYIEGEKDIHVDSAIINYAEINFALDIEGIEINENTYLMLEFHFPGLLDDEYTNRFENIKITEPHYEYKNTMSHFMAHFDITNALSNAVDFVVDFKIISDGTSKITSNAKINFKTDIKFINFDAIYGHIWQKDKYKSDKVVFDLPADIFQIDILKNNNILFSNPQLDITLHSNIGVPLLLQIEEFHYTKSGETYIYDTHETCNFPITIPDNIGESYTTNFKLDKTNSPIAQILSSFPERIELDWAMYANDSVREHTHYFINPVEVDMDFEVTIPFQFDPTTSISYRDTIETDLESLLSSVTDIVNIDTLVLYLDIANSLPASTSAKLYYLDENYNLLFESNEFEIEAGEVDGDGKVINPTIQNKEIGFNSSLAQKIMTTKNLVLEITLKTKDDNSKIYIQTTDKVDIDLSAYAKAKINFSTNIEEE